MPQSHTQLLYHIVYSTKGQRPSLAKPDIRKRVHEYLSAAIRGEGGAVLCIGGIDDHVHILARLPADKAIAAVIDLIKERSAGWIHREYQDLSDFAWQTGFAAFTVSKSQKDFVRRFIERQEEHHRQRSFREDLLMLLRAHEVELDERSLWD
jgi:REP element-mobilizing transposase RayT